MLESGDRMHAQVKEVLSKIEAHGYEAYLVGGYPRDTYLSVPTEDYDICTSAHPSDLKKILPELVLQRYGSCIYHIDQVRMEITTYRVEESYQNHRFVDRFHYVENLSEDLKRRDFVMNTLCMDKNGNYIDLMGARNDIDDEIIRSIGNASVKLEEDVLRILRAIRFQTQFHFRIDKELECAILENRHLLKVLSYDRKKEEVKQILSYSSGISNLLTYQLEESLELNGLKSVVWVPSFCGIWAQLEENPYPLTRQEKKEINQMRHLLSQPFDVMTLYETSDDVLKMATEIKKEDWNVIQAQKKDLPIQNKAELKLKIASLLQGKNTEEVARLYQAYRQLEKAVVRGEVLNREAELQFAMQNLYARNQK